MKIIRIDKKEWNPGLTQARQSYRLVGPVADEAGDVAEFRTLDAEQMPDLAAADTVLSPKAIVYPQSEVMFEYSTDPGDEERNILKRPAKAYDACAVVGIRPYDAAAFTLVRKNFDTPDYRDPYWCDAYEACTFVGLAVNQPDSTDFSTSVDSGPFSEKGLDVLLVDTQDAYLAKVLTEKGEAFMTAADWQTAADASAEAAINDLQAAAEAAIQATVQYDRIKDLSILDLYNAPFWEDVGFACINCGTCTYVCPTCWCFDIQDEVRGKIGRRFKNWDTCMETQFTLHASGHNPRGDKVMRVRQRFMHKLKYFLDKYEDGLMCVGCGRCVRSCPVNIDIRKVCNTMNSYDPEACACPV